MNSNSEYDSQSDNSTANNSTAPNSPREFPKDLPLMDRMNKSVASRAKRVKRAIEKRAKGPKRFSIEDVNAAHEAADKGDIAALRTMIEQKGLDPNVRSASGTTLLHTAVKKRNLKLIEYLLSSGVKGLDINAVDNDNKPAIAFAKVVISAEEDENETKAVEDIFNLLTNSGAMVDEVYFQDAADAKELKNTMESSDVVDAQLIRKVIVTVSLPFIFLIFVNGIFFALKFLLVSIAFYFVAFGYFISEVMLKPPWWHHNPNGKALRLKGCPDYWEGKLHNPKRDLKLDYHDITVTTHDGVTIRGWFVPSSAPPERQSKMALVFVHGGGRDRRAWLRHIPFFSAAGYGCILFDMRDHGLSGGPGKGLTFGMRERYDLVAVAAYARERLGFASVAAIGTSIGGSTCIMAAAIDPKIDIVIAENPLLTAAHLQDKHISKMFGPYFNHARYSEIIFAVFRFICSNWINIKLGNKPSKRCQSVHVISKIAPRPVLLMHGTFDDVVPFYHSETLFSHAQEPKELWLVPEAVHCCLHNKAPDEFEFRVLRFLAKHDPTKTDAERVYPQPPAASGFNSGPASAGQSPCLSAAHAGALPPAAAVRAIGAAAIVGSDDEEGASLGASMGGAADPKQKKQSLKAEKIDGPSEE